MKNASINMENYEIYLMDYFDNQLSEYETELLMLFLESHPLIKEEANDVFDLRLPPDEVNIYKENLKKDSSLKPKNSINKQNADEVFVANLEGDLTQEQKEELRVFIEEDDDLKKDFELSQKIHLAPDESIKFEVKETLYLLATEQDEAINAENFEEYCIAYFEGDLNEYQTKNIHDYISDNKELKAKFSSYGSLHLQADTSLKFANKTDLKKYRTPWLKHRFSYSNAAAVAAIFIFLLFFPGLLNNPIKKYNLNQPKRIDIENVTTTAAITPDNNNLPEIVNNTTSGKIMQKTPREPITITSMAAIQPKISMEKSEASLGEIKPLYISPISTNTGYYEVTLEKNNFITKNPTLVKRFVKGVRNMLNISPQDIQVPDDKLTLWDVADAGLKGFGALTENEVVLLRR